ncbi:hypothetical protein GHT06_020650 [Daphnia sinensis]|uniref:Tetratricopeptide repeat protein 17 n=1 Tax=Daphnia sinensis TaxID=1820382 RepID=A0AAD5KZX8_9CRUS|nr:hypothetical protein GHT06_020650 [Daphnia sinensis]
MRADMMFAILIIKAICILPLIWATTHWVVTQNGRITPQMDSIFQLEKSHDLMALLAQEDCTARAELLREELFQKKVEFEHREDKDSGALIEEKLYATDPDCLKVGRKVTSMAIFESTHSDFELYNINFNNEMLSTEVGNLEPDCSQPPLDFSMRTFEHLTGLQNRFGLTMEPEASLEKLIPANMDLKSFANWVAFSLQRNSTSWLSFNLATLYYRIVGNAVQALECSRRALLFSPKEKKTIALVNMGNILTHSHQQEDGIIVLHAAVDHNPSDPIAHYTLANSYALIGDLNRSVLCYENVLKLKPDLKMAIRKMHGIQCLSKLEKALETQHNVLQHTLTELKEQQRKFEEWNQLQENIVSAQATVGQRLRSQLEYQEFRFRTTKSPPPVQDCEQYEEDGFMFFQCNIKTDMSTLETWGSAMMDLRNRLVDFQTQTDKIVDLLSLRSIANQSSLTGELNPSLTGSGPAASSSVRSGRSASFQFDRSDLDEMETVSRPLTESELQRCPSLSLPKIEHMPTVLLLPESTGLDVMSLLNERIGLRIDEDHPLPWYPPICEKHPLKLLPYDEMSSIKSRNEHKKRLRDVVIQRHLLSYARSDVDQMLIKDGDDDIQSTAALAQVGQRILTALRNKIGPSWLLHTLAALYWRGHGRASNGIECFRQALNSVPEQQRHIPLTNLAGLLLKMGQVNDALSLASAAYQTNNREPKTNYLLGLLHLHFNNHSVAVKHFDRALKIDPDSAPEIEHYRLMAACHAVQKETAQHLQCQGDLGSDTTYRTVLRCSKTEENEESESNCEAEVQGHTSNPASLEVAAIADTDDDFLIDSLVNEQKFINFELLQEESLPEGLLRMGKVLPPLPLTLQQCQGHRIRLRSQFTSTWLSVAAKNIDFKSMLPKSVPSKALVEPVCNASFPVTMATFDHLTGVRHRDKIDYRAESALEEALNALIFDKERIDSEEVARYLTYALKNNATSWVLTTAASLYWRVKGHVKNAIDCLRIALHHAPYDFKDIPLTSLANILHRAGLHNDALVAAYMALEISPTFVVIHFTAANIHAARGDVARALSFYQSTLALQPSFEPARQQLIELQCKQLLLEQHSVV